MQYDVNTPAEYIEAIPVERKPVLKKLRSVIRKNIPKGFKETIQYKMISYVVPHSIYPDGYHCTPTDALPFISIASQKNFVALYHMGIYAMPKVHDWFVKEYPKYCQRKLDMGKSCVRFKYMDDIPYDLIGELMKKITVDEWIAKYEKAIKK